nr:disease resistance protein RPM1-like [Ipomoea batatas]
MLNIARGEDGHDRLERGRAATVVASRHSLLRGDRRRGLRHQECFGSSKGGWLRVAEEMKKLILESSSLGVKIVRELAYDTEDVLTNSPVADLEVACRNSPCFPYNLYADYCSRPQQKAAMIARGMLVWLEEVGSGRYSTTPSNILVNLLLAKDEEFEGTFCSWALGDWERLLLVNRHYDDVEGDYDKSVQVIVPGLQFQKHLRFKELLKEGMQLSNDGASNQGLPRDFEAMSSTSIERICQEILSVEDTSLFWTTYGALMLGWKSNVFFPNKLFGSRSDFILRRMASLVRLWIAERFVREEQSTSGAKLCKPICLNRQNIESSNQFRRLVIHRFDDQILKSTPSKKNLRSLLIIESLSSLNVSPLLSKFFTGSYNPLKVLELGDAQLEEIPEEIFNLFQLKYLSLKGTKLRSVPKSIGRLQNLETLDLRRTRVNELPAEVSKLCKLRHLLCYSKSFGSFNPWSEVDEIPSFNAQFKGKDCASRPKSSPKLQFLSISEFEALKWITMEEGSFASSRSVFLA